MLNFFQHMQEWDLWLTQAHGQYILNLQKEFLAQSQATYTGQYTVVIGTPAAQALLEADGIGQSILITPVESKLDAQTQFKKVIAQFDELPILSHTIDVVLLPHTLEMVANPEAVLLEACRILKADGRLIILGFNPLSIWGLGKIFKPQKNMPWQNKFYSLNQIQQWLNNADFVITERDYLFFHPILARNPLTNFIEWLGNKCFKPCGGLMCIIAKPNSVQVTPIRLGWQPTAVSGTLPIPGATMQKELK